LTGCKNPVDTVTVESILTEGVPQLPDLNDLSHAENAIIRMTEAIKKMYFFLSRNLGIAKLLMA